MKFSNWSILGYIAGSGFSLFSAIRYFLLYPDWDKAIVYVLIGTIICGLAWIYNRSLETSVRLTAIEDYLSNKKLKGGN